ncbi:MAG TPA: sigma 54-interacting transcriptional regulator [Myxococcales bacterium]|jgi:formate hydrogenlyase transcriptional activator
MVGCHGAQVEAKIVEEAITAVLSTVELSVVLDRTAGLLRRHFGETRVAIHKLVGDAKGQAEILRVDDPRSGGPEAGSRFALDGTAVGEAIASGKRVIVDPLAPTSPRYKEETALAARGYGSLVTFPLVFEGVPIGALEIAHPPQEGLLACCLRTAEQVARLAAIALHNSLMVEEVRRLNRLLDKENARLREELREIRRDERYVAESPAMKAVLEQVRRVAGSESTVLVRGETGTGKEGLARMIHDFSPRFSGPFVVVNMGAIPESLIESELFGHEKGAFTGAQARRAGRFEQAHGGTLFLDEIGDAPLAVQVRLLRVLQEREVQRVGAGESFKVDVRVVAATNRPLEKMVGEGRFREDLFYRLNVFPLVVPPLRERREDVRPLATYFLARQAARMHRHPPRVGEEAWRRLESARWPGNVRELENYLERALILSTGDQLILPEGLAKPSEGLPPAEMTAQQVTEVAAGNLIRPYDDQVKALLERALASTEGKIYGPDGAAAILKLQPTTLQGKLRKYGIQAKKGGPARD